MKLRSHGMGLKFNFEIRALGFPMYTSGQAVDLQLWNQTLAFKKCQADTCPQFHGHSALVLPEQWSCMHPVSIWYTYLYQILCLFFTFGDIQLQGMHVAHFPPAQLLTHSYRIFVKCYSVLFYENQIFKNLVHIRVKSSSLYETFR